MLKNTISITVLVCAFGFVLGAAGAAHAVDKVVFASRYYQGPNASDCNKIYTMDPDGSNITRVGDMPCNQGYGQQDPIWTDNGTKIMFTSGANCTVPRFTIMSMDADGTNITPLTSCEFDQNIKHLSYTTGYPSTVAAISPFGQFVIVFMLGGATALYLNRRRQSASA